MCVWQPKAGLVGRLGSCLTIRRVDSRHSCTFDIERFRGTGRGNILCVNSILSFASTAHLPFSVSDPFCASAPTSWLRRHPPENRQGSRSCLSPPVLHCRRLALDTGLASRCVSGLDSDSHFFTSAHTRIHTSTHTHAHEICPMNRELPLSVPRSYIIIHTQAGWA